MENEQSIDYLKEVQNNIEMAKILSKVPEKDRKHVFELLLKKREIKEKNSFFAEIQLSRINKQIEKYIKE